MSRWMELFTTRRPVYERLADLVFDVRHGSVPELGRRLEESLRDFPEGAASIAKETAAASAVPENVAVKEEVEQ
jgi:shikimate kinase